MKKLLLGIICIFCGTSAGAENASTVYTNAKIYTSNDQVPWASSVVVKEDKIVHVGNDSSALAFVGPDARIVDLAGKLVLPVLSMLIHTREWLPSPMIFSKWKLFGIGKA